MKIIVKKETNEILAITEKIEFQSNGNPVVVKDGSKVAFIAAMCKEFDDKLFTDADVTEEIKPLKYCYTQTEGFYLNPNWEEPNKYNLPNETVQTIKDDTVAELIELGVL